MAKIVVKQEEKSNGAVTAEFVFDKDTTNFHKFKEVLTGPSLVVDYQYFRKGKIPAAWKKVKMTLEEVK